VVARRLLGDSHHKKLTAVVVGWFQSTRFRCHFVKKLFLQSKKFFFLISVNIKRPFCFFFFLPPFTFFSLYWWMYLHFQMSFVNFLPLFFQISFFAVFSTLPLFFL
jgi:hypothetical protein